MKVKKAYSFCNHSTPTFIKGPLHDCVIGPWWTWPNNKGVRHAQPINSYTKIRLCSLSLWSKHLKPNSAGTNLNLPSTIQTKPRCTIPSSDLDHAQRCHLSRKNHNFLQKAFRGKKKEKKKRWIWNSEWIRVNVIFYELETTKENVQLWISGFVCCICSIVSDKFGEKM